MGMQFGVIFNQLPEVIYHYRFLARRINTLQSAVLFLVITEAIMLTTAKL